MSKVKQLTKTSKWVIAASCLALTAAALAPVSVVVAKGAQMQEQAVAAEEVALCSADAFAAAYEEVLCYDDGSVEEIELNAGIQPYTDIVDLGSTLADGKRILYHYRSMKSGNSIGISVNCNDSSVTYRIGIKNRDKNYIKYVDVSGAASHTFSIDEDGVYSAFVENNSGKEISVSGSANYFD